MLFYDSILHISLCIYNIKIVNFNFFTKLDKILRRTNDLFNVSCIHFYCDIINVHQNSNTKNIIIFFSSTLDDIIVHYFFYILTQKKTELYSFLSFFFLDFLLFMILIVSTRDELPFSIFNTSIFQIQLLNFNYFLLILLDFVRVLIKNMITKYSDINEIKNKYTNDEFYSSEIKLSFKTKYFIYH